MDKKNKTALSAFPVPKFTAANRDALGRIAVYPPPDEPIQANALTVLLFIFLRRILAVVFFRNHIRLLYGQHQFVHILFRQVPAGKQARPVPNKKQPRLTAGLSFRSYFTYALL